MFIPNGASRQQTAILLTGTASEFGINQRSIRAAKGGFHISDELARVLYDESAIETSGNRAAKNVTEKE